MVRKSVVTIILLIVPFFSLSSISPENPMTGIWKTIDDKTGDEKSLVEIKIDEYGNLRGKVIKLFRSPEEDQNPLCDKCNGERKNAPVLGMEILWGFSEKNRKDLNSWNSGHILDPKNGVKYGCNLSLEDSGNKLKVRGYVGFSLIGRTQTWIRISQ